MDLTDFKELTQGVYALVSSLAILVGGGWAYWKFVVQRERTPRAEFDISAEFIGQQDGKWIVEVSAHLANNGKVRHLMKNATLNIRYITATDPIVESSHGHFQQIGFPYSIGRRKAWWDSYIDPGLKFRNSYVAQIPVKATYVLLLCRFEYDRGEEWPVQRVIKVPRCDLVDAPQLSTALPTKSE